jgi:hypothetical protein
VLRGSRTIPAGTLTGNRDFEVSLPWTVTGDLQRERQIYVRVDPTNVVRESDEQDNVAMIRHTPLGLRVDWSEKPSLCSTLDSPVTLSHPPLFVGSVRPLKWHVEGEDLPTSFDVQLNVRHGDLIASFPLKHFTISTDWHFYSPWVVPAQNWKNVDLQLVVSGNGLRGETAWTSVKYGETYDVAHLQASPHVAGVDLLGVVYDFDVVYDLPDAEIIGPASGTVRRMKESFFGAECDLDPGNPGVSVKGDGTFKISLSDNGIACQSCIALPIQENVFHLYLERNGDRQAHCLFNWSDSEERREMTLPSSQQVRDFWTDEDLGRLTAGPHAFTVPPRSARLTRHGGQRNCCASWRSCRSSMHAA